MTRNSCTQFTQNAERYSVKQELPALCRNDFSDYKPVLGRQQYQESDRQAFLRNSLIYTPAKITGLNDIINKRTGHGNYDIYRHNFLSPENVGRVVDFDELAAVDLANFGARVTLSDKTLDEISSVRVPDPGDKRWLTERDRLIRQWMKEGNNDTEIRELLYKNMPLGREQRFMMTRANVNDSVLTMAQRLFELATEVRQGKFESKQSEAIAIVELATIINDDEKFNKLAPEETTLVPEIVNRVVKGEVNHRDFSLNSRYIDNDAYNQNSGMVKAYLMGKVLDNPYGLTEDKPVMGQKGEPMMIASMITSLGRSVNKNRLFLDLEVPQVITWTKLLSIAEGFNGGLKNPAFDISPALIDEFKNRREEDKNLSNEDIKMNKDFDAKMLKKAEEDDAREEKEKADKEAKEEADKKAKEKADKKAKEKLLQPRPGKKKKKDKKDKI